MTNTAHSFFAVWNGCLSTRSSTAHAANLIAIDDVWIEMDNNKDCILTIEEIKIKASTFKLPENQW